MIPAFKYLKNCHVERELDFLSVILEGRTRIKGMEIQEGRHWLDRREFGFLKTKWATL